MSTRTRTPAGLGRRGKALWLEVAGEYELGQHEAGLLLEAARTLDQLDALAAVVAAEGVMEPSTGRAHPALVESRQLRLVLARLVASLRLPEEPEDAAGRPQRRGAARGVYGVA